MVPEIRKQFNAHFTQDRYQRFLEDLHSRHTGAIEFRIAETPIFIPKDFGDKIISCCEQIIDVITEPDFLAMTQKAIPPGEHVPGENRQSHCIAFDFGICEQPDGSYVPQLIEMQGFPTLFGFQVYYPEVLERHFEIPANYSHYFNGLDKERYIARLREMIMGSHNPDEVVLLEIKPHEQKTRIDFYCTQDYLGIRPVCLTELIQEGKALYYLRDGKKTRIRRVYNRIIFDDLRAQRDSLGQIPDITSGLDVEWIPHPNWFYRISKFTMPFIRSPYIPETFFLNEVTQLPDNLDAFVLKPLFSFAGQGVVIDLTQEDIDRITDPENWILQRKVKYADIIETPDVPAKAEIRMMYIWQDGAPRPELVTNLARMSKGKMIGVRYNKDKEWVGASVCYFEK